MGQEESVGKRRITPESGHEMKMEDFAFVDPTSIDSHETICVNQESGSSRRCSSNRKKSTGEVPHWQVRFFERPRPKIATRVQKSAIANVCKREICFSCCRPWSKCNTIRAEGRLGIGGNECEVEESDTELG